MMTSHRALLSPLSAPVLLLFLAALPVGHGEPAPGQPPETEPEEAEWTAPQDRSLSDVFLDTLDVDVVNVEVVVTDRSGEPVRGLTREDFVVTEDGRPVELTNFYAVEGGHRASREAPVEDGLEAGPGAPAPLPDDQRLNLVVLVDEVHIGATSRSRVLEELQEGLDRVLRPADRVLVARATPGLDVVQPFTDDLAAVSAALEELRGKASRGALLAMEERDLRRALASGDLGAVNSRLHSWASEMHQLNRRLLSALNGFVDALAGLPGRRAVLYVSEGMTVRPAQHFLEELAARGAPGVRGIGDTTPQAEASFWDATAELVRLTRAAAGSHVTFYSLDADSGFPGDLDPQVAEAGPAGAVEVPRGGALADLAWRTGGSSVHGGSTRVLLDRMAADYRDYYSLGYTSPHSNDGEYHRIEVEVPGRRVRVRHTQGFRATTPAQETAERAISAVVFDAADNPLGVRVELGREEREGWRRYVLPVMIRVPVSSLTLLPGETAHHGRLLVVVAVRDAEGGLSEPKWMEVPVEVARDRVRDEGDLEIGKGVNLLVKPGESTLAVGVRDHLSGTVSTLNLSLSVGGG